MPLHYSNQSSLFIQEDIIRNTRPYMDADFNPENSQHFSPYGPILDKIGISYCILNDYKRSNISY
jgi:hypothetical protein